MANRIAISSKIPDARAQSYLHTLQARVPESGLTGASVVQVYTIDAPLSPSELDTVAQRLTNPVTEAYTVEDGQLPTSYAYAIDIGFLPGVTDNVGKTARETVEDSLSRIFQNGEDVYSSKMIFLDRKSTRLNSSHSSISYAVF